MSAAVAGSADGCGGVAPNHGDRDLLESMPWRVP